MRGKTFAHIIAPLKISFLVSQNIILNARSLLKMMHDYHSTIIVLTMFSQIFFSLGKYFRIFYSCIYQIGSDRAISQPNGEVFWYRLLIWWRNTFRFSAPPVRTLLKLEYTFRLFSWYWFSFSIKGKLSLCSERSRFAIRCHWKFTFPHNLRFSFFSYKLRAFVWTDHNYFLIICSFKCVNVALILTIKENSLTVIFIVCICFFMPKNAIFQLKLK